MKLETEQERKAFLFICNLASELISKLGCNDLTKVEKETFKGLEVERDDNGKIIKDEIRYDFDIMGWLQDQSKKENEK